VSALGLGSSTPSVEAEVNPRKGWLKHTRVALSSAGGAAIVLAMFELLQRQPQEGFKLLTLWGPWPIIALVALGLMGSFMSRMNDTVQTAFSAIVTSVQQQANSSGKMADAVTRLADQGGKQAEEVRRLAIYAAREFPAVYDRFDQVDATLRELTLGIKGLHWAVNVKGSNGGDTNEHGT
jgi:hypothetical protein